jgi:hypothetical protein
LQFLWKDKEMEIIIFLCLLLVAILFFFWIMRSMISAACPHCLENGREEMVIPILPGFRWFCPTCSGVCKYKEALDLRGALDDDEG